MEKYTLEGLWEEHSKHVEPFRKENKELVKLAKKIYKVEEEITLQQLIKEK